MPAGCVKRQLFANTFTISPLTQLYRVIMCQRCVYSLFPLLFNRPIKSINADLSSSQHSVQAGLITVRSSLWYLRLSSLAKKEHTVCNLLTSVHNTCFGFEVLKFPVTMPNHYIPQMEVVKVMVEEMLSELAWWHDSVTSGPSATVCKTYQQLSQCD